MSRTIPKSTGLQINESMAQQWLAQSGFGGHQQSATLNQFMGHVPEQMIGDLLKNTDKFQLIKNSSEAFKTGLRGANYSQLNEFWIDQGFGEQNITTSKGAKNPWNEALWEDGDLETRTATIKGLGEGEREALSSQSNAWEPPVTTPTDKLTIA